MSYFSHMSQTTQSAHTPAASHQLHSTHSHPPQRHQSLPSRPSRSRQIIGRVREYYLPPAILGLTVLLVWEVVVRWMALPDWLLPTPSHIGNTFLRDIPLLWGHALVTLQTTALGFALALSVGFILAVLIDAFPIVQRAFYPLLVASQTIPIVALAPLLIIGFGFGMLPKVFVVALVVFFPIVINTVDGLRAADRDMLRLLRAMGASYWQITWLLRIPAALPAIFSGLKISVTYSIIGAVLAEWIGSQAGLGVYIARSLKSFRTDQVFVAIMATSLLTIGLFLLVTSLERWLNSWNQPTLQ